MSIPYPVPFHHAKQQMVRNYGRGSLPLPLRGLGRSADRGGVGARRRDGGVPALAPPRPGQGEGPLPGGQQTPHAAPGGVLPLGPGARFNTVPKTVQKLSQKVS